MRFSPFPFFYIVLAVVLLLTQGCTTLVADIEKQPGYSKNIDTAQIRLEFKKGGTPLKTTHTAKYNALIIPELREKSGKLVDKTFDYLKNKSLFFIAEDMKAAGVKLSSGQNDADARITLTPEAVEVSCLEGSCRTVTLDLVVRVFDLSERKQVWRGLFFVYFRGLSQPEKFDAVSAEAVENFSTKLVKELQSSGLLRD